MNRALESRLNTGLQLFGILAVLISIVVLFAAADRLRHNRNQMVLVGEVTRILIELRQLSGADSGDGLSDDTARLIGFADVQTSEISSASGDNLFSREAVDLKLGKTALLQTWKAAKKVFVAVNSPVDAATRGDASSRIESLEQQFSRLHDSFGSVFTAISRDTLSPDLLTANSQLLATLKNLDFVLSNRNSISPARYSSLLQDGLFAMQTDIERLQSRTTANNGSSLIGYETRQLLTAFVSRHAQLTAEFKAQFGEQVSAQAPVSSDGNLIAGRVADDRQLTLATALQSADNYQRLLEFASHQNRRAILFAIAALCVALICLMLSLWRAWRSQASGNAVNSEQLEQLRLELTEIADGNLHVRASPHHTPELNAIAHATNHTVDMLIGLVRLFRRAADHLNELSVSQQLLAKRWITSEIKQHKQLDMLSQNLQLQSQAINQLHEIEASQVAIDQADRHDAEVDDRSREAVQHLLEKINACRNVLADVPEVDATDNDLASVMAGGIATSTVVDSGAMVSGLNSDGLLKMRQRMHELTGSISAVRLSAEQARLQVLNTSLQMTAYAGTAEIDEQSKLVEDIQNISNQLASSAAGAERMSSALADELQQYAEANTHNRHQLVSQFDELQQSATVCLSSPVFANASSTTTADSQTCIALEESKSEVFKAALEHVQHQQAVLQQLLDELRSDAGTVSEGDSLKLLEQIGDMQKISAGLARSAEQYGTTGGEYRSE